MKVIGFTLKVNGVEVQVKNFKQLKQLAIDFKKELGSTSLPTKEVERIQKLLADLENLSKGYVRANNRRKKSDKETNEAAISSIKQLRGELKTLKTQYEGLTEAERQSSFGKELASSVRGTAKEVKVLGNELKVTQKDLREAAAAANPTSYNGLKLTLAILRDRYKNLSAAQRNNKSVTKSLLKDIDNTSRKLQVLDKRMKIAARSSGVFANQARFLGNSLSSFLLNIGVGSFMQIFAQGVMEAVQITIGFDKAITDLGAITQKSRGELSKLEGQALELGATTAYSATQVVGLQTELAKLGFPEEDILASTKAIIDFSVATEVEASRAAALAGATLKAFGLDAKETERVVSVLGVATTKSALDFSKLETAMAIVAPVAKTFNFSVEESVALLGSLSDAGFDASSAGTATRNILLNLADSNGKLARELGGSVKSFDELIPALVKLRDEGVDLNKTLELTDKRSVAAFNQFLRSAEATDELKRKLTETDNELGSVNDQLQKMADDRLQSVAGRLTLLRSAFEGFVLSIEKGDGAISQYFKFVIDNFTNFFSFLTKFNNGEISISEIIFGKEEPSFFNNRINNIREQIEKTTNVTVDEMKKGKAAINKAQSEQGAEAATSFEKSFIHKLRDSTSRQIGAIEKQQAQLRAKLKETELGSADFKLLSDELKRVTKQLDKLKGNSGVIKKKVEAEAAEDSMEGLRKKVSDLNKELNRATTDTEIEEALRKISDKEEDIRKLTVTMRELQDKVNGTSGGEIEFLPSVGEFDIADNVFGGVKKELEEVGVIGNRLVGELEDLFANAFEDDLGLVERFEEIEDISKNALGQRKEDIKEINEAGKAANEEGLKLSIKNKQKEEEEKLKAEEKTQEERKNKREEFENQMKDLAFNTAGQVISGLLGKEETRINEEAEMEIESLEASYERRIEAAEGDAALQASLQQELESRKAAIELEAAKKRKKLAIKEAIIQGALATIKGFATGGPFGALAAAAGVAAQIIIIKSTPVEEFEQGGEIKGNSHAQGGVPMTVKSTGQKVELEGGEGVLKKSAMQDNTVYEAKGTAKEIASGLNVLHGGRSFSFARPRILKKVYQDGGEIAANNSNIPAAANSFVQSSSGTTNTNITINLSPSSINQLSDAIQNAAKEGTSKGVEEASIRVERRSRQFQKG